jgi:hypothetical protein
VIASPLNGVVYNDLLRARGNLNDETFTKVAKAVLLVGAATSLALLIGSLIGRTLFNDDLLLAGLAAASVSLQIVAAIQRAIFSALGKWRRFSAQFLVEGLGRIVLSGLVIQLSDSLRILILVNVLSQAISLLVAGRVRFWWPRLESLKGANLSIVIRSVGPYLLAGFTIQSTLSMTPFYARTTAGVSPIGVAALGGLVQVLRIPTTMTVAIVMPRIRQGSQLLLDGMSQPYRRLITQTVGLLFGLWIGYGLILVVALRVFSSRLTYGTELGLPVLLTASLVCALGPISTYTHTAFMFHQKFGEASRIWGACLVIFVVGCSLGPSNVLGILSSVVASLTVASLALYRLNLRLCESPNHHPNTPPPSIIGQ